MYINGPHESDFSQDNFLSNVNTVFHNSTKTSDQIHFLDVSTHMENVTLTLLETSLPNATLSNDLSWIHCLGQWLPPNHILFQIANVFLFLSYLAPVGIHGLLYLRTCLMIGSIFFALWGWVVLCALDTFIWNAVFTLINFIHVIILLYMLRPVKLSKELEEIYKDLFKPLQVSRHQFMRAISCMREIKHLKPREPYCVENVTKVDRLSLVISGRLVVSQNGHALHIVDSKQFLDSPEWFGVCTYDTYQVSITALEDCRVLIWHRDKLKLSISNDIFLQAVFDNILGKDVVKKLLLVSETSCNGVGFYVCDDVVAETTKLLAKNKQGQTGLSVLLTRQVKNRDTNVWNLAKKGQAEHDTETSV
ncbi:blood vessel epicardial substance-A [Trichonephila inaurata madagascariensis]|uniref:Blood vessel epicardial substance-A n=1 Tax=Trichonephila inaurata madagascariensis TaxID=2747483 RepID=A0A8X6Y368_9ARAC|nr:blood vessel epicardial substance-A [Trichonephila inaurata madagascariensis]